MKREEMLKRLKRIPFNVLWPEDSWEDLGFTESPVWIDNHGYGYYYCDEPNMYYKLRGISNDKWQTIRNKLNERTLLPRDLEGTALSKLYFCHDEYFSCDQIVTLLNLPEQLDDYFYCADDFDDVLFFKTREEMAQAIEERHREYSEFWEELSDELLDCWIERLCTGKYDNGFNFYETIE